MFKNQVSLSYKETFCYKKNASYQSIGYSLAYLGICKQFVHLLKINAIFGNMTGGQATGWILKIWFGFPQNRTS